MSNNGMTVHMNRVLDVVNAAISSHMNGQEVTSTRVDYTWIDFTVNSREKIGIELSDRTRRMEFMKALELVDIFERFTKLIGVELVEYRMTDNGVYFVVRGW